ncbi:MAG: SAF domain-containing protein [Actinomycetota bacterium]
MTVTTVRPDAPAANGTRLRPSPRRRSWPLVGGGIAAALIGSVVAASAALSADRREPVLALARPVQVGHVLGPDDLRTVRVGADQSLPVVPASDRSSFIGQVAAVTLPAGTLLQPAHAGAAPALGQGEASVGVALEPGRFPPRIGPGSRVVAVEAATATDGASGGELATGVVTTVDPLPSGSGVVVGLQLPREAAAPVATAASARRLSLFLLPAS